VKNNLFKASLGSKSDVPLKSYDIGKLLLVGFFGGLVSMGIIGTINGIWLKLDRKILIGLGALALILLCLKLMLLGMMGMGILGWDYRTYRMVSKIGYVALFLAYYFAFKKPFTLFVYAGGIPTPLLKPGLLWILIGGLIEFLMVYAVSEAVDYDIF